MGPIPQLIWEMRNYITVSRQMEGLFLRVSNNIREYVMVDSWHCPMNP